MSILSRPHIKYFRVSTDEVFANEEVLLEWEVENAGTVRLDGMKADNIGNYSLIINDTRTFELTASNWKGRESQEVTVRLFKPVVYRFEADDTSIKEGEAVGIHFRIKHTQVWKIVADYGRHSAKKNEVVAEGKLDSPSEFFDNSISVSVKGACVLTLITKNGLESGLEETIRLYTRHLSLELHTNQTVVKQGSSVHITWKAEHANRLILNPGNYDVTNLSHFDFPINSDRDIQMELKAFGDFGQQVTDTKTLYLARINNISASNNGDSSDPEFYLNWSATGLHNLKLLPENIPVNENEVKFKIPGSTLPASYTLVGQTYNDEEVSETIMLCPCTVHRFLLEKGKVIVGTMATLLWDISNTKKIQLKFSDSPVFIDIPALESKHHFQVFKGRDKVKLIAWGDVNVTESEIPITAFESPEIKLLRVPGLSLRLDVNWIASPLVNPAKKVGQLFSLTNKIAAKERGMYWKIWTYLTVPAQWIFNRIQKFQGNRGAAIASRIEPATISENLSSLPDKVFTALDENLKNMNNEL